MPASVAGLRPDRPEDLVEGLSSLDSNARLKALRDVKNQIIGNKTKKLSYIKLGAVPRVVEILASNSEIPLLVQSAAAVGSFACGIDVGVQAVLDSGVLPHLLRMLSNDDPKVVEAGARSLRMIFQSTLAPRGVACQERTMDLILALLTSDNDSIAEVAASVLARCCETQEHQLIVLAALLRGSGAAKTREAALDALAALTRGNERLAATLIDMDGGQALSAIVQLVKDKAPRTRLLACLCLANLGQAAPSGFGKQGREVRASILSTLIKLFDEPGQAPAVLGALVGTSEELHRAALDADAITKLAAFLHRGGGGGGDHGSAGVRQRENVLLALAALCSQLEDSRRQLYELKALGPIVDGLVHESPGVRAAACSCLRSFSRSVQNLRTCLTDAKVVQPLFNLLSDPSPSVQAAASAAICNIVLDFSFSKVNVLHAGSRCGPGPGAGASASASASAGLSQLVALAASMDATLRLNAVWALKNLAFQADLPVKALLCDLLGPGTLLDLVQDADEEVQEHALGLLRNLVHGSSVDVQLMVAAEGGQVIRAAERQLYSARTPEILVQNHKELVMSALVAPPPGCQPGPHVGPLRRHLQASSYQVRVAACWCAINLSFHGGPGVGSRVARMREAGVEQQLRVLENDTWLDVKDRATTALEQFEVALVRQNAVVITRERITLE
eukprot:jgi/Mesen1/5781/ME000293S04936